MNGKLAYGGPTPPSMNAWSVVGVVLLLAGPMTNGLAAYTSDVLAGTWSVHILTSGDAPQFTGWAHVEMAIDSDGAFNSVPGSYVNSAGDVPPAISGVFDFISEDTFMILQGPDVHGNTTHGALTADKSLIVMTMNDGGGGYGLGILQKRSGATFTSVDLAGTWSVHGLVSGDAPDWLGWFYMDLAVGAQGGFSVAPGTFRNSRGETDQAISGTFSVTSQGVVTMAGRPDAHGTMSADKSLIVVTMDDDGGGSNLYIMQKRSSEVFSADDLTGVLHMHTLAAGDAPQWTGWLHGDVEVRSAGVAINSFLTSSGEIGRAVDNIDISSDGVVTSTVSPSTHGVMSDDKNLIVLTMTDGGGGYDLVLLSRATDMKAFTDYGVGTPEVYGIRTFQWTYGRTGQWTSAITETVTVDYGDGSSLTGVKMTNVVDVQGMLWDDIACSDGSIVRTLALGNFLLSSDSHLTHHPDAWSFGQFTDGMLFDMRPYYLIRTDPNQVVLQENQIMLVRVQDIQVLHGPYAEAQVGWMLDTRYPYVALDLADKGTDLGLVAPTSIETGGYAVTGFRIYGFHTGVIALGGIDPETGQLERLGELEQIDPFVLRDWNEDGIVSIVGDVPPFVNCVYFQNCPDWPEDRLLEAGDCNGDGILSIIGDVPCFVDCVYFGNCS